MQPLRGAPFSFSLACTFPNWKHKLPPCRKTTEPSTPHSSTLSFSLCVCVCVYSICPRGVASSLFWIRAHVRFVSSLFIIHILRWKSDRKMCLLNNYRNLLHTCFQGSKFISPNTYTNQRAWREVEIWVQDHCNPQNGFFFYTQFPISLLSHLCWHTNIDLSKLKWDKQPDQEMRVKKTREWCVWSVKDGWRDREATSYSDQLIYKSNQWESMTSVRIQSGFTVIQLATSIKETEEGKGETDTTHGKHWNISKIKKSLIATNTKKYKDMTKWWQQF